ncbi:MAG: hypothetical protein ACI9LM_002848 [Alteromonadaceae bacterium]|jgi:uncharacterized protein (DUF342 family)
MSNIELIADELNTEVTLVLSPVKGKPLPDINAFKRFLDGSNYKNFSYNDSNLNSSFEQYKKERAEKKDDLLIFSCVIANAIDATLSLSFSENDMVASIELTPAQGGKNITIAILAQFLIDQGLKLGIYQVAMESLVKKGEEAKVDEKISLIMAKGRNPVNGDNGYIDYLVPDPTERVLRPKILDDGFVDMRDLGEICFVKKGLPVAKLINPTAGINGFDVKGKVLEAQKGEPCTFECGDNAVFLNEEKLIIIADIDGMPKHQPNGVSISNVFIIKNVDVSTGNINFDGSVIIEGNVCEAMKVISSNDVIVAGFVESAAIKAGGDICIGQSVIGHKVENEFDGFGNSTTLDAVGNIFAKFVQYSNLRAKGNITVEQYIAQSQVTLHGNLWIGREDKADGKLFSSYIQAGKSVKTGVLGSISGAVTSIDFNHLLDALEEYKKNIKDKSISTLNKTQKVCDLIEDIENKQIDRSELLQKLNLALSKSLPFISKLNRLYYDKDDIITSHCAEIEVIVTDNIFPGAEIAIVDRISTFQREHGPNTIFYRNNKIVVEPIVHN